MLLSKRTHQEFIYYQASRLEGKAGGVYCSGGVKAEGEVGVNNLCLEKEGQKDGAKSVADRLFNRIGQFS